MEPKKIWSFNGSGNYSESFGWDNGMSTRLGDETTFEAARKEVDQRVEDHPDYKRNNLPDSNEKKQIAKLYECSFNEHGGNRVVSGYVVAKDRNIARYILQDYENTFPVVERISEEDDEDDEDDIIYADNYPWPKNEDANPYIYD